MADLGIVSASVVPQANCRKYTGLIAGEAISAGFFVYRSTDGKVYKAQRDAGDVRSARVLGMALNSATAGQTVDAGWFGDVAVGVDGAQGTPYFLSDTAGLCCPAADVTAGFVTYLGVAKDTNMLFLDVRPTGLQVA